MLPEYYVTLEPSQLKTIKTLKLKYQRVDLASGGCITNGANQFFFFVIE